jgi:hypothetical protein
MVKNTSAWMKNWKKNIDRPPASWELRSMAEVAQPPPLLSVPHVRVEP